MTKILCEYNCGNEGIYILKNGKFCCSKTHGGCKSNDKSVTIINDINEPIVKSKILSNFDKYFCEHEKYISTTSLREFIKRTNLLGEYKCKECNLGNSWNGKSITLHLDHINGNRKNNKLENLRWLCPNCHSQTKTFAKKHSYKRKQPVPLHKFIEVIPKCYSIKGVLDELNLQASTPQYEKIKNIMLEYNLNLKEDLRYIEKCKECEKIISKNKTGFCASCIKLKSKTIYKNVICKEKKCNNLVLHGKTGLCKKCIDLSNRIVDRPPVDKLISEIKQSSVLGVSKKYGVSDNSIRKWLKSYGLPFKKKDLKLINI